MTPTPPSRAKARLKIALQIVGFLLCLAILGWCIYLVARDEKLRNQFTLLLHQPWHLLALFALSTAILFFTGLFFRAILKPVARIPIADAVAINTVCALLSNLPGKLSLVFRFYIHKRRHGLAYTTILAWMGAAGSALLISIAPPMAATLLFMEVNARWWLLGGGGTVVALIAAVIAGRIASHPETWAAIERWSDRRSPRLGRLARSEFISNLRHWLVMLADWRAVSEAVLWRTVDFVCGAARFYIAAAAVAAAITVDKAIAADSVYYFIQSVAPTGALGAREGGTIGILTKSISESLPVIVLSVTAAELAANIVWGIAAAAYLRVWNISKLPSSA